MAIDIHGILHVYRDLAISEGLASLADQQTLLLIHSDSQHITIQHMPMHPLSCNGLWCLL